MGNKIKEVRKSKGITQNKKKQGYHSEGTCSEIRCYSSGGISVRKK